MICGIVDLGSNTIRLSIYKCEQGSSHLLMNRKVMAGLAGYSENGRLSGQGIGVACHTLSSCRTLLDNLEIGNMYVFATASLRNVTNTQQVVEEIQRQTGIGVDVISGREEAELSFRGALMGMEHRSGLLVDLGGGSTELVRYEEGQILSSRSLCVGSLNLFDRYVSKLHPEGAERKAIRAAVREQLEREQADLSPAAHICGVGGTVRAACKAANLFFDRSADCRTLSAEELKLMVKRTKKMDKETLRGLLKAAPDRVHTLIPGLLVLDTVCRAVRAQDVTASASGVREGYLHKRVLGEG